MSNPDYNAGFRDEVQVMTVAELKALEADESLSLTQTQEVIMELALREVWSR